MLRVDQDLVLLRPKSSAVSLVLLVAGVGRLVCTPEACWLAHCVCVKLSKQDFFLFRHSVMALVNVPSGVLHITLCVKLSNWNEQTVNFVPYFQICFLLFSKTSLVPCIQLRTTICRLSGSMNSAFCAAAQKKKPCKKFSMCCGSDREGRSLVAYTRALGCADGPAFPREVL